MIEVAHTIVDPRTEKNTNCSKQINFNSNNYLKKLKNLNFNVLLRIREMLNIFSKPMMEILASKMIRFFILFKRTYQWWSIFITQRLPKQIEIKLK
jgi:hypothetical protein